MCSLRSVGIARSSGWTLCACVYKRDTCQPLHLLYTEASTDLLLSLCPEDIFPQKLQETKDAPFQFTPVVDHSLRYKLVLDFYLECIWLQLLLSCLCQLRVPNSWEMFRQAVVYPVLLMLQVLHLYQNLVINFIWVHAQK